MVTALCVLLILRSRAAGMHYIVGGYGPTNKQLQFVEMEEVMPA
jgi:hypothetical protein